MLAIGDTIDSKYKVEGLCSDKGGMGTIYFVQFLNQPRLKKIVLKLCKEFDSEAIARFCREVKYLKQFSGNSRVVQIIDDNLNHQPAYFVMDFFERGDLFKNRDLLINNLENTEKTFNMMIDCIGELHLKNYIHRDIKPENFLLDSHGNMVVSDFGLAKEHNSGTTFTGTTDVWGTSSYLPPEFRIQGFRDPHPTADIFMLGKSFYALLTNKDPMFISDDGLNPSLFRVIEKCTQIKPEKRYFCLSQLKQDLLLVFDVLIGRAQGLGKARQILAALISLLESQNQYNSADVISFLDLLAVLPKNEKSSIINEIPEKLFMVFSQNEFTVQVERFLVDYEEFALAAVSTWSYAEIIAKNMALVFRASTNLNSKSKALDIAINCAAMANRFAAMDTCRDLIYSVEDNALGLAVSSLLLKYKTTFVSQLETAQCKSDAIIRTINKIVE
ncbi:MAG: protein kinase [Pseudomonadota bacterium]